MCTWGKILGGQQGLTMMELMVVIAILAIMAGISISALSEYIPDYRLGSAVRQLVTDLHKAKTEAIKRNTHAVVVFNPGTYSPNGEVGSYMVFIDDGEGGGISKNFTHDGEEEIIMNKTMPRSVSLYCVSFTSLASANNRISYNSLGLPKASTNSIFGSIYLRNNKSKYYRVITNMYGGIRISESTNGTFS
jgi:type IV fimbrial biogenesis protein FimT